jgi:hypothetical protein
MTVRHEVFGPLCFVVPEINLACVPHSVCCSYKVSYSCLSPPMRRKPASGVLVTKFNAPCMFTIPISHLGYKSNRFTLGEVKYV